MPGEKRVRVGNAGGYWGDDPHAMRRQLAGGPLDYVTQDFLAEITMSILQKQKARDSLLGYATDFLSQLEESLPLLRSCNTRIISNAGGIHPEGCAEEVERLLSREGISRRIGVIRGDDLTGRIDRLLADGNDLSNMETGEPLASIRDRILSANAYLGMAPVIEALEQGADILVTGRVTDTAITAAAPAFEFDWPDDDWDRIASAVVAGHILECGAQATGGNLSNWRQVPTFRNMGFPIAEFAGDGSFTVTKHERAGGLVTEETVISQLIYEMGDPARFVTPDVVADLSRVSLRPSGVDRVEVSGIEGSARPATLKVSIAYHAGWKAHGTLLVSGPDAVDKARTVAGILWERLSADFEDTHTELIGFNASHLHLARGSEPGEVLLRLSVRGRERSGIEEFAEEFTALILSSVGGVAILGSKPKVQEVVAYWPCLLPGEYVRPEVLILNPRRCFPVPWVPPGVPPEGTVEDRKEEEPLRDPLDLGFPMVSMPLRSFCFARSGDKGDVCNIGLATHDRQLYHLLCERVTPERVKAYFGELCRGKVERFEIPNLNALNFLLHDALGGGGTVSLRVDPQGKTMAEALLNMEIELPESVVPKLEAWRFRDRTV